MKWLFHHQTVDRFDRMNLILFARSIMVKVKTFCENNQDGAVHLSNWLTPEIGVASEKSISYTVDPPSETESCLSTTP